MSSGRDDALRWDGDDDPTLDVGRRRDDGQDDPVEDPADEPADDAEPLALPHGFTAVGKGSGDVGRVEADGTVVMPGERAPLSNVALVTLGVLAGAYVLFTIGWIVGGLRLQGTAQFLVSPLGYQFALWLAAAAPALWFGSVYVFTRDEKTWVRIVWLLGGLALLIPWPFVMVGAIGR